MAKCGYSVPTGAAALTAATARTVLGVRAGAAHGMDLVKYNVSFDGVTATAVPVLVELCYCTFATNEPGTNSTNITANIIQRYGRVIAWAETLRAGSLWTTEPTVLTVLETFLVHPQSGYIEWTPLGQTSDSAASQGFAIRCTAPAAVSVRASMFWERC